MTIEQAAYEGGWLKLKAPATDALKWLHSYKAGKDYDIVKHVDRRSMNANSYAWVLIGKIAEKINLPAYEVYIRAVDNIGGKSEVFTCKAEAVEDFKEAFVKDHIARDVKALCDPDKNGRVDLLVTYGSSDYNTAQMSKLIDSLLQECTDLGIETKDPGYIASLLEEWK